MQPLEALFYVTLALMMLFTALFFYFVLPSDEFVNMMATVFALYFCLGFFGLLKGYRSKDVYMHPPEGHYI